TSIARRAIRSACKAIGARPKPSTLFSCSVCAPVVHRCEETHPDQRVNLASAWSSPRHTKAELLGPAARHMPPAGGVPSLRQVTALVVPTAWINNGDNVAESL